MKIIKNILAVSVLCACTLNVAAMELCGGCCGATWVSQYDSVANCYKCYLAPYVTQAKARPIYGRVAATIVEYDTVIVSFFPETDVFRIDIDTITGIGTIDQATDSLKIDCDQWETGLYSIRGYVNVTTEMIPQFDSCFPLDIIWQPICLGTSNENHQPNWLMYMRRNRSNWKQMWCKIV